MVRVGTTSVSAACDSLQWSSSSADTGGGAPRHDVALPAAKAATITSGVLTFASAHGYGGTEKLGIYGAFGKKLNVTINTHDTLTVTLTADGHGDSLPTGGTAVTVSVGSAVIDGLFDGDHAVFVLATCDQIAAVDFVDVGAASVGELAVDIPGNGYGYYWSYASGVARPVTGNAATVAYCYNSAIVAASLSFVAVTTT